MMTIQKFVYLYFRGTYMTNIALNTSPAKPESAAEADRSQGSQGEVEQVLRTGFVRAQGQGRSRDPGRGQIQPRQRSGLARRRRPVEGPPGLTRAPS
jgi:hypothetical protein